MFTPRKDYTRRCAVCGKTLEEHHNRACTGKEAEENEDI